LAITKQRKEELVAAYKNYLSRADGIVITEYRGLSVKQVGDLRARLRDVQGRYVITKNTLFKIALSDLGWPVPESLMIGTTGVALAEGDFPTLAKSMIAYVHDNEAVLSIKGGVMAGMILNPAQVETVSNLPSLDELRAQLAGLIVQPAAGLVSVLNAGVGSVAQVLAAYVQKHESEAAA
jgi:large subunit ribosomal protein L10